MPFIDVGENRQQWYYVAQVSGEYKTIFSLVGTLKTLSIHCTVTLLFNWSSKPSGKNSNIKIAEIWEKSRYQKCGNMGKNCGNMATYDFSYAEFWQLIDFSQFAEIWENVAELWCFPKP
jgi:hypothetical protein